MSLQYYKHFNLIRFSLIQIMYDASPMSFNNYHNKQNINSSNFKSEKLTTKSSQHKREITQTDSDTDIEPCQFNKLSLFVKKSYLKTMISQTLRQRRANDKIISQKQIYGQKIMFKAFIKWKNISKQNQRNAAESQLLNQTKLYNLKRQSFLHWAELIKIKKTNKINELRKSFDNFKIGCSNSLSLRLRRIELQNVLIKKRVSEIIFNLSNWAFDSKKMKQKAEKHWRIYRLNLAFEKMQLSTQKQKNKNIRFQKYQLAYLFRRMILLKRTFRALHQNNNEK